MKRTIIYKAAIILLILTNIFLVIKLKSNAFSKSIKPNQNPENGFFANGVRSGIYTNANFSKKGGLTANQNDTILIDHHLKIMNILYSDTSILPMNYLFELNPSDSTFKLLSESVYTGNNDFKVIIDSVNTKLFFLKLTYPSNDKLTSFQSCMELRVFDSAGNLSPAFDDSLYDAWYNLFNRKYGVSN